MNVKLLMYSVGPDAHIMTFELEYPRFIHAELMTHRLFSRNAASSRAIPIGKMMAQCGENPAMPHIWGLNQPGMQAETIHIHAPTCEFAWKAAANAAVANAAILEKLGLHKQIVNRVLEPFQMMKTVVTATEYDNWFYLRMHEHAQPEIRILAEMMWKELQDSQPQQLEPGEWHVPYVGTYHTPLGIVYHLGEWGTDTFRELSLEEALRVSSSCCAQVSYRVLDDSLKKAEMIYERLVASVPVHASPFEHQGTPMEFVDYLEQSWPKGVTHMDRNGDFWSGNLKEFIQYRQLLDNHTNWDYTEG